MNRGWVYQRERFPLLQHGPLVLAFSFSALSYSRALRGAPGLPPALPVAAAFVSCLLFFLQLRIADEFKDFAEDAKFRPYRPVPRGLVTLRELGAVFAVAAALQFAIAAWLCPRLILLLLAVWAYLAAMTREFFAREWLKARPLTYMVSHMFIMPQIDLYATSADWLVSGARPGSGLPWFLLASFFNGMVIEVGRKIRAPEDEERGVETYSALYGPRRAVLGWALVLGLTTLAALRAAALAGLLLPVGCALGLGLVLAAAVAGNFLRTQKPRSGRAIEAMAGAWTLLLYLSLGAGPMLARAVGGAR
jgi:4-hydroxybenzoate polyprenyltransferase